MVTCGQCGWENPGYAAFCTNCGTSLSTAQNDEKKNESWRFRERTEAADESDLQPNERGEKASEPVEKEDDARVDVDAKSVPTDEDVAGVSADSAQDDEEDERSRQVHMGIRPAATLIDLSVPDFREMVGRGEKVESEAPGGSGSEAAASVSIALADTESSFEAVQPEITDAEIDGQREALEALNESEGISRAPAPIRDLGSLDVSIESIDGNLSVSDLHPNAASVDDSSEAILSSVDLTPIGDELLDRSLPEIEKPEQNAPPPMPPADKLALFRVDDAGSVPFDLEGTSSVIGRSADIGVESDEYMSPEHARLTHDGSGYWIEDNQSLNGVWVRARDSVALSDGTLVLMGQQVFKFVVVDRPVGEQLMDEAGTRRFGSPRSISSLRLLQLSGNGETIAQFDVPREGCKIGRVLGDFVVADDDHLSTTHALVLPDQGDGFLLRDVSGRNGCWVRVHDKHAIGHGDVVLTGRSLWRLGRVV